jgi:deoxyadenosine/deoxycytidine kinase
MRVVGKSTLLAKLRDAYAGVEGVVFVDEPVVAWEQAGLLSAMYDGRLHAAVFQMMALSTRYAALRRALTSGARLVVSERSLWSDRCVFAATHLKGCDKDAYDLAHDSMLASLPATARATILLDAPVATLLARVAARGRDGEGAADDAEGGAGGGGCSAAYLAELDAAHARYYAGLDHHAARVDAADGPAAVARRVVAAIDAAVAAAAAGPPKPPAVDSPTCVAAAAL